MRRTVPRRSLVKSGLSLVGASAWPWPAARAETEVEPHFFIYVTLFLGADASYLFDARPLAMTAAGKIQNYSQTEPVPWAGLNGGTTLANPLVEPLRALQADFSVVNGVVMATGFEGHEQNQNFLFTGNVFGGESFIPHLNRGGAAPIDCLNAFPLYGVTIANGGSTIGATFPTLARIGATFAGGPAAGVADPTSDLIRARIAAATAGSGAFSAGSRALLAGFEQAAPLAEKLRRTHVSVDAPGEDGESQPVHLQVIEQFFRQGISRSLIFGFDVSLDFDAHGVSQAKEQPKNFARVAREVADLIRFLKATPFREGSGQSLFDVTTVLVGGEFSRTMRQLQAPSIDETGTDHNTLTNSFLLAGKGIRGGQVIGASDLTEVDAAGALVGASGAHRQMDPQLIKVMGRPFDYDTFRPAAGSPEEFDLKQYLSFGSIANTLYQVFGVSDQAVPRRRFSSGGAAVPVLRPLLA